MTATHPSRSAGLTPGHGEGRALQMPTTAYITWQGIRKTVPFVYGASTVRSLLAEANVKPGVGETVTANGLSVVDFDHVVEPKVGVAVQIQILQQDAAG